MGRLQDYRHYFYNRKEVTRTTWRFRVLILVILISTLTLTRTFWAPVLGWSLVNRNPIAKSDVILINNQDVQYLLFERTGELQKKGMANRVVVPVEAGGQDGVPGLVPREIAKIMSRVGQIGNPEFWAYYQVEPITYNLATQLNTRLKQEGVGSIILVSEGFRSKRDFMIFNRVLSGKGIKVYCEPVFGLKSPENWINSWHGVQEVILQLIKLQYYRARLLFLS
jgi:hypothetical protein